MGCLCLPRTFTNFHHQFLLSGASKSFLASHGHRTWRRIDGSPPDYAGIGPFRMLLIMMVMVTGRYCNKRARLGKRRPGQSTHARQLNRAHQVPLELHTITRLIVIAITLHAVCPSAPLLLHLSHLAPPPRQTSTCRCYFWSFSYKSLPRASGNQKHGICVAATSYRNAARLPLL